MIVNLWVLVYKKPVNNIKKTHYIPSSTILLEHCYNLYSTHLQSYWGIIYRDSIIIK